MLNARERSHYAHKIEEALVTLRAIEPCIEHMIELAMCTSSKPKLTTLLIQIRTMRGHLKTLRDEVIYCQDLLETVDES